MNIKTVIVSLTITNIFGVSYLIFKNKVSNFDYTKIILIIFTSIFGVVLGGYSLGVIDSFFIKKVFGLMIIFTGLYDFGVQKGYLNKFRLKSNFLTTSLVGLIGGFFSGLIGAAGTIYALYFNQTLEDKKEFKLYISIVFLVLLLVRAIYYVADPNTRIYYDPLFIVISIPAVFIGVYIGNLLTEKVSNKIFKEIVSISIILMGVYITVSNY